MASYTDNLNILTSHPQYVSQLPVEAMTQVGVAKQQAYNEGIQRIQSSIDSVAGLDVSKDIHKQYLQSKLNELGGKLKTVAAGDFSNFQLVNNVMGMTNQIVKDPVIQNAVYSTQVIRKGQQELDKAKQDGKSSPQNEAFWNKQITDWQNDGDLNTRFNGSYISYTDVGKKLREVADKIHEIDSSIDTPYKRDAAGNVLYDKNNNPIVDDAMLRIKTKGKPAEKILANFMNSLDENDQRQLGIDSWYHYRGVTKDSFKNDIVNNYNSQKKLAQDEIVNLNLELQTNTKLTSAQKAEGQARINSLSKQVNDGYFEKQAQLELASIDNVADLDSYKYKVYTQKYLTNLAKDMSYQSYQQEIVSNPYAQMDMEKRRLQFSYENMAREQRNFEKNFGFQYQKWLIERQEKEQKDFENKYTPTTPGVLPTDIDVPTLNKLGGSIEIVKSQINDLNSMFAPIVAGDNLKTPQEKTAYLDGLMKRYNEDPNFINSQSNDVREYLERRRVFELDLARKNLLFNKTKEQGSQYSQQLQTILKSEPSLPTPKGGKLSNNDIFEVQNAYANALSTYGTSVTLNEDSFLSNYPIGSDKRQIAEALVKNFRSIPLSQYERNIINQSVGLSKKYGKTAEETLTKQLDAETQYLLQHSPERQTVGGTVKDKQSLANVSRLISDKSVQLATHKDIDMGFSPDNIAKLAKDKETNYHIRKNTEDGSGTLYVVNGSDIEKIPLTSSELSNYFPDVARQNPMNNIIQIANFSPNKTTNLFGGKSGANAVNAYITGYSAFTPQLSNSEYAGKVRFDVEANPFNNGDANDTFQLRMYALDENGNWITGILNNKGYSTITGIQEILGQVGTKTVQDFISKYKK